MITVVIWLSYERLGTGATAVGLRTKDFVVLGSEKRFGYGGFVMSKTAKKVYKVSDRVAIAAAGIFADILAITRILSTELKYHEISTGYKISVKGVAKYLSAVMYTYKYFPFITEVIVGGIDDEGTHVYVMDPVGSVIEDDYAAVGTGAPIAIGIIESGYKNDLSLEQGVDLVVRSLKAAASRDTMSGDGIDVAIITANGIKEKTYPIQ